MYIDHYSTEIIRHFKFDYYAYRFEAACQGVSLQRDRAGVHPVVVPEPSGLQDIPAASSASGGRGRGQGRQVHRAASASSTPHPLPARGHGPSGIV